MLEALASSSPVSSDVRLAPALAVLADPGVRVVSFDVFDTLVWRRVPDPVDAFELVGARARRLELLPARFTPAVFRRLRIAAEARARGIVLAERGVHEIGLRDVYAELRPALGPTAGDLEALVAAELAVERELLMPDLEVCALLARAHERGKLCIAVSDTYFTPAELRGLLDGLVDGLDRLFCSSAEGVGKGGGLWPRVLAALEVEPAQVLHVGDHEDADGRVPRRHGIRTFSYERRDRRLDTVLERERRQPGGERPVVGERGDFGLTALRAKVLHRPEGAEGPPELRRLWRYGAASLGPALTGFAEWVHGEAREAGAERVFCLMREGDLLADLVERAAAYVDAPVAATPAWLSRQVLARAAIRDVTRPELETLLKRRSSPTVRSLCASLDIAPAQFPALAAHEEERLGHPRVREEVFATLLGDPELRTHLMAVGADARDRVLRYVRGLHDPEAGPLVLVDLGWQATTQGLLARIAAFEGVPLTTLGLYLVTNALAVERQLDGLDIRGFLGQSGEPDELVRALGRTPELLEQVCMPDHGSQVALTSELEPLLAPPAPESPGQGEERRAARQGILAFQAEWARYQAELPGRLGLLAPDAAPLLRSQLVRAVTAPTEEEARGLSAWLHDENFGSPAADGMVAGVGTRLLRHMDAESLLELSGGDVYWPWGLAALHDEHLARTAELVATGAVSWRAFSSPLETGEIRVWFDNGWGYATERPRVLSGRRNRFGLTLVQARTNGDDVRAVRIEPARGACLLRLDWVVLRGRRAGASDPVEAVLETPAELARLAVHDLAWIGPKVLQSTGPRPRLELAVRPLLGSEVHTLAVQVGLAVLPVLSDEPDPRLAAQRVRSARRRVRRLELATGLPVTPVARRLGRLARRRRPQGA